MDMVSWIKYETLESKTSYLICCRSKLNPNHRYTRISFAELLLKATLLIASICGENFGLVIVKLAKPKSGSVLPVAPSKNNALLQSWDSLVII